ncbi:UDP-glucose--Lipooligosaccharide beta 1-4 glucosyltransferase [Labilithrix luteola]|uniref:UDP-glucose--Lipooligosaccharide beta 1-4 glucosyltransferase n=1 Tax=Labilithrix luteola TaxID=1391654 RepID=A0A0K1PJT0_9BACT|nr:glycosyltransferase family 2 protein [Labilithrix luteola]AKU93775.1 UDP-glucose--Lipooligosaccharide beta 1-4 glucosyltransferase [Labilithrix luteola]
MAAESFRTLSLCMIVRDEESNIEGCLRSVQGVVDEIVVVDTGSKDRTITIARDFGALVVEEAWTNDFSAPRNRSIELATKDWILVLAADERIAPASGRRMREVVGRTRARGLQVRVRNLMPAGETALFDEVPQTRLFERRTEHRYEGIIHEQIAPSIVRGGGTIAKADLLVVHHGYQQDLVQGDRSRARRNLTLLEKQVELTPRDPYVLYNLGCTYKAVGNLAAARGALEAAEANDHGALDASSRLGLQTRLAQLALASRQDAIAVARARKALAISPSNPVALQVVALGLVALGDRAGALAAFAKLRRSPVVNPSLATDIDRLLARLAPAGPTARAAPLER